MSFHGELLNNQRVARLVAPRGENWMIENNVASPYNDWWLFIKHFICRRILNFMNLKWGWYMFGTTS